MIQKRQKWGGTHRIPSIAGEKSFGAAARVSPKFNVLDAPEPDCIQPRIYQTKRLSLFRNKEVIKQREYARHCLDIGGQLGA